MTVCQFREHLLIEDHGFHQGREFFDGRVRLVDTLQIAGFSQRLAPLRQRIRRLRRHLRDSRHQYDDHCRHYGQIIPFHAILRTEDKRQCLLTTKVLLFSSDSLPFQQDDFHELARQLLSAER